MPPIVITQDMPSYTFNTSNVTLDLNGRKVDDLIFAPGLNHARVTNGRVGTFRSAALDSLHPETPPRNSDLIIDHLLALGGPYRAGNQIRVTRCLVSDVQSVAADSSGLNGIRAFALWLDPGSSDVVVQDVDLWTSGAEACFRGMACKRVVIHSFQLGVQGPKHCLRFHGSSSSALPNRDTTPCEDVWASDGVLRRRGCMIASQPDGTQQWPDIVRRVYLKRLTIDMLHDNLTGFDSTMMFGPSGAGSVNVVTAPTGQLRLDGLVVEDVRYNSTWDPMVNYAQLAAQHSEMHWTFARNTYRRIP